MEKPNEGELICREHGEKFGYAGVCLPCTIADHDPRELEMVDQDRAEGDTNWRSLLDPDHVNSNSDPR